MYAFMNSQNHAIKNESSLFTSMKSYLLRPFLTGLIGFVTVLLTLLITYYITAKYFHFGIFVIDSNDLLISLLGFVILFWYEFRKKFLNK
jgi:hypothetical protein